MDDDSRGFVVFDEPVIPHHDLWRPLFERVRVMRNKKMKIKTVSYERLKKHDTEPFENVRVGAEADVEDGEDPGQVLSQVKAFVHRQLGEGLTIAKAQEQLDDLMAAGASPETVEAVARDLGSQVVDSNPRNLLLSTAQRQNTRAGRIRVTDHLGGDDDEKKRFHEDDPGF